MLEWNSNDRSSFLLASGSKLELCRMICNKARREIITEKNHDSPGTSNYTSLSWHKNESYSPYVAYGLSNGVVGVWNSVADQEVC